MKLQIATGVLPVGSEMPSTRAMSAELSLNPMTISKAYSLLDHDHVLERHRGQTLVVREPGHLSKSFGPHLALKDLNADAKKAGTVRAIPACKIIP